MGRREEGEKGGSFDGCDMEVLYRQVSGICQMLEWRAQSERLRWAFLSASPHSPT
jgi:hypothetical protein